MDRLVLHSQNQKAAVLPKRIILVRHGESQGNCNGAGYISTPDNKIPLSPLGVSQACSAGSLVRHIISSSSSSSSWKVYFYVSPYERARSTLREIGRAFPRERILGVREEVRVREQDFGNFQAEERRKVIKQIRERFNRFFYRFPEGESAADVYDRISSFLESLWRDIEMNRLHHDPSEDLNLVIVSHGLALRVFLMKWFKWTAEQFEHLNNFGNCEPRVMQLGPGGEYSLAIHHDEVELQQWGLTPEMIADQKWRAQPSKGASIENSQWYLDEYFDTLADSENNNDDENGCCQKINVVENEEK